MRSQIQERLAMPACTEPSSKNKRASAPKVKTGCRNCKASHIKCDEQKPICGRCSRRDLSCRYPTLYSRRNGLFREQQRPLKAILPATQPGVPLCLKQPTLVSLTPEEAQYFDSFRQNLVVHLVSDDSEFWHRTVPRESIRDECVRSAVVALGALARAMHVQFSDTTTQETSRLPLSCTRLEAIETHTPGTNHYYQALSHYTDALGAFRRRLACPQDDTPRAVLIASILLASFEYLQGNTKGADQLGAYTLDMLREIIMQGSFGPQRYPASVIAAFTDDVGVQEAETILVRSALFNAAFSPLYPSTRSVVHQLPVPYVLEPRPPSSDVSCDIFARMCLAFCTLVNAWHYRILTTMPISHLGHDQAEEDYHDQTDVSVAAEIWWTKHLHQQTEIIALLTEWLSAVDQRLALPCPSPTNRFTYQRLVVALKTCYHTVSTVFDPSGSSRDYDDSTAADDLLTRAEAVFLASAAAVGPENNFDPDLLPSRSPQSLPRGAAARIQDPSTAMGGSVLAVGMIARDPRGAKPRRRRAMELYARMVSGSSHWDVQAAYLATKAVFDAEEEEEARDPVTGEVPLAGQWFWADGWWSDDYTDFWVVLGSRLAGLDGMPVMRLVPMLAVAD